MQRKRQKKQRLFQGGDRGALDVPFLALTLMLLGIGLVMLFSASYASAYYNGKNMYAIITGQAGNAMLGLLAMYGVSLLNYRKWKGGWTMAFFLFTILLLVLVLVPGIGQSAGGATRWIKITGIPRFQPSELVKLAVILLFAERMAKRSPHSLERDRYSRRTSTGRAMNVLHRAGILELLPYGFALVVIVLLLKKQPHMSATILILVVAASILFVGGIHMGWFVWGGGLAGGALLLIMFTTDYMKTRLDYWLDPWSDPLDKGLQAIQSLLAIGSGGLTGLGLGNSRQKFLYLPEEHNDFIFSIICEELGFFGAFLILVLFALLILRGYWLAMRTPDRHGMLLIVGVVTLLAFQVFFNIAVVTNLMPVTGISLPFFSYGGTALIIQLVEMGIVLSVSRQIPLQKDTEPPVH